MLSWPNIGEKLQLWLFLVTLSSKAILCELENVTCLDGDCGPSTLSPVHISSMHEQGISVTTEVSTTPTEATTGSLISTTEIFISTRDSKDQMVATSLNKLSPPTQTPAVDPPVKSRRIKTTNRTHPYGDLCPCDLLVGSCDPNCCCDVLDCTEEEKEAFSYCLPLPSAVPDPRLCQQYKWISTPNRTMELQAKDNDQKSLLCISRDNNPSRLALADYSPARSLKEFKELIGKKQVFQWPSLSHHGVLFSGNSSYKVGDVLWAVEESTLLPLELMSSGFNSLCQRKKLVRFLENWKSSCVLPLPFVEEKSAELRVSQHRAVLRQRCSALGAEAISRNLTILSSPLLWPNSSTSYACPPESCIRAQQWVCGSRGFDDCIEVDDLPRSELQGDVCKNVVMAVRLVVDVLGVNIHSAQAYFVLSNISFGGEASAISRVHSVSFKWWSSEEDIGAEYDKDRMVWKRSGSPGYITGEPVMAGWKETVVLGGEDVKQREEGVEGGGVLEAIRVTPHADGWLTMLGPVAGTHICGGPRKSVRFRHSARWSCSLPVFLADFSASGCAALKRKALSLLLGLDSMGNLSERFIAMYGDSAPERLSEWLPLKMVSHDGKELSEMVLEDGKGDRSSSEPRGMYCRGIHSSVHLEIATALVGSASNPQAKVLGAVLRMGPPIDLKSYKLRLTGKGEVVPMSPANQTLGGVVENKRGEVVLHLVLVSSVTFVDVTNPPVMEVAPPPVYHIRLPHDFFHPFLSSVAPSLQKSHMLALTLPFVTLMTYSGTRV